MKKNICRLFTILLFILSLFGGNASPASGGFYTIQAGAYSLNTLHYAGDRFNALSRALNEYERDYLRIEQSDKYFIVRLGRFDEIAGAGKVLETVKTMVSDAFILEETAFENSKVLIFYDEKKIDINDGGKPSEISISGEKEKPSEKEFSDTEPAKNDPGYKEDPVARLLDDVSVHYYNQDYGKASELLKKGLAEWPDDPDLHAWYGATLLDTGFPDKAYEEYRKAAELFPAAPEFHAGIGHSLLSIYIEKAKNSVDAFKKALEIDPNNVSALEGLGIVYVSIDRKHLATEIYKRLVKIDPEAAARLNQFIVWGLDWGKIE
ncbi:MAG: tetratricopeptide repeat protein [Nitrospirota bacterium]